MSRLADFRIINPFNPDDLPIGELKGIKAVIPAGTLIRFGYPQDSHIRAAKKTYTVTVLYATRGYISGNPDTEGMVSFPQLSWTGKGWRDVQVTPELAAANGVSLPELINPGTTVVPSYSGYTDRWSEP